MSFNDASKSTGGLKGMLQRTGRFFYSSAMYTRDTGKDLVKMGYYYGGQIGFMLATTSMIVLMPLMFEIAREGQMLEADRAQVKDLKSRGYSDRQLQELGFNEAAIHNPSVASATLK